MFFIPKQTKKQRFAFVSIKCRCLRVFMGVTTRNIRVKNRKFQPFFQVKIIKEIINIVYLERVVLLISHCDEFCNTKNDIFLQMVIELMSCL